MIKKDRKRKKEENKKEKEEQIGRRKAITENN